MKLQSGYLWRMVDCVRDRMKNLLKGIKAGDLVEFDLITNPVEVDRVERESERGVMLSFKCHSGYWGLEYGWDGTQIGDKTFKELGIPDAFDIVKVIRTQSNESKNSRINKHLLMMINSVHAKPMSEAEMLEAKVKFRKAMDQDLLDNPLYSKRQRN